MMHGTAAHSTLGATELTSLSPSPVAWLRHLEMILVASLSIGAGVIHLAAASSHLELLGDLALGFYWAALFQVAFAVAFLARSGSHDLARVGVAVNLVLIGAWAWSRTVGLPMIPGGPEAVGLADGTTVGLQVLLVALLTARIAGWGGLPRGRRPAAFSSAINASVFLVAIAAVAFATSIAASDGLAGHSHGDGAHARSGAETGTSQPALVHAPHGHAGADAH